MTSFTSLTTYERCPEQYRLKYIERWRTVKTSINLVFGSTVDKAVKDCLRDASLKVETTVRAAWAAEAAGQQIEYNAKIKDADDAITLATKLVNETLVVWREQGWEIVEDQNGTPLIDPELVAGSCGYDLCYPDFVIEDEQGLAVIDLKTAASDYQEGYTAYAEQLHIDLASLQANSVKINRAGFLVAVKLKTKTRVAVHGPVEIPQERIDETVAKDRHLSALIAQGVFYRRPLQPHDSPCKMCDFQSLCWNGETTGLYQKPSKKHHVVETWF
jgi:CRISPR/Cas system-associated exonuclease Cas4 (RecB family)